MGRDCVMRCVTCIQAESRVVAYARAHHPVEPLRAWQENCRESFCFHDAWSTFDGLRTEIAPTNCVPGRIVKLLIAYTAWTRWREPSQVLSSDCKRGETSSALDWSAHALDDLCSSPDFMVTGDGEFHHFRRVDPHFAGSGCYHTYLQPRHGPPRYGLTFSNIVGLKL